MKKYLPFLISVLLITSARVANAAVSTNSLIKLDCPSGAAVDDPCKAVYYYGSDRKRHAFPTDRVYFSWYPDFSTVTTVSASEMAAISLGSNVTYRPGVKMIKIATDPKVYVVAAGGALRWVTGEAVATSLYGSAWNTKIDDVSDAFFVNYTVGADISEASSFSPSQETANAVSISVDKGYQSGLSDVPLKELGAQRGIRVGGNYDYGYNWGNATHDALFEREYNLMTSLMLMDSGSRPSRTEFDFTEMDNQVNWGQSRGMDLHGHTLVWFAPGEMADWVKATPSSEIETVMNEHIDALVGRYAGKIKMWDVVNEAVDDVSGTLRQGHVWWNGMGDDYIRKAFIRARAADPGAILRINEYDIESKEAKFNAMKSLLTNLKNQGVPVQALGWQMHVKPGSFDPATLLARMNEIADLGIDNYISELDVELPPGATAAEYEAQKQTFKDVVETFLAARRHKTLVFWGLRDGSPDWLKNEHGLLFDEAFNKKPAYSGVQEALLGK